MSNRNLPQLLLDAERRVNANVWPNKNPGADSHLASIPANRDTDTDLLLIEAADRIRALEAALKAAKREIHAGFLPTALTYIDDAIDGSASETEIGCPICHYQPGAGHVQGCGQGGYGQSQTETDLCNCVIGKNNTACPVHGDVPETACEWFCYGSGHVDAVKNTGETCRVCGNERCPTEKAETKGEQG